MHKKIHGRHGSRWVALQALYAWLISGERIDRIEEDLISQNIIFIEENIKAPKVSFDKTYLHELIHQISQRANELFTFLAPHVDRPLEEVNPVEQGILLIAMYELIARLETPYKVIINEAILLAKQFGAQDSHKFVNGVLDKAAKVARASETQPGLTASC